MQKMHKPNFLATERKNVIKQASDDASFIKTHHHLLAVFYIIASYKQ